MTEHSRFSTLSKYKCSSLYVSLSGTFSCFLDWVHFLNVVDSMHTLAN
jgi:hypothetical protein